MTIEERIERLERTNRRYRLMFTLLGVLAVCAVGMSAAAVGILGIRATAGGISATQDGKVHDVIWAKTFVAVDATGSPRAWLSGGNLTLQSSTTKHGLASVTLLDKADNKLVAIGIDPSMGGGGEITVSSTTGRGKVRITTNDEHKRPVLDDSKTYPPGAFISVTGGFDPKNIGGGAVLSESSLWISKSLALNPEVELTVDENGGAFAIRTAKGLKSIVGIDHDQLTTSVPVYVTTDDGCTGVHLSAGSAEGVQAGQVVTFARGKPLVGLTARTTNGGTVVKGAIDVFADGKLVLYLGASENGGELHVRNKTGEGVCTLSVDEYGNGVIGAWNRSGKGRTLKPGP